MSTCIFCINTEVLNQLKPGTRIKIFTKSVLVCDKCVRLFNRAKVRYEDINAGHITLYQSLRSELSLAKYRTYEI